MPTRAEEVSTVFDIGMVRFQGLTSDFNNEGYKILACFGALIGFLVRFGGLQGI